MAGNRILMKAIPKGIQASEGRIRIEWSDAHQGLYQARDLRLACRCAACVDEWTHKSLVKPDLVPQNVKPKGIEVIVNYAIHNDWSDAHNPAIDTYHFF